MKRETETITFAIDKDVLAKLRQLRSQARRKKGFMGRIISQAADEYLAEKERDDRAIQHAIKQLEALIKQVPSVGSLRFDTECAVCRQRQSLSLNQLLRSAYVDDMDV